MNSRRTLANRLPIALSIALFLAWGLAGEALAGILPPATFSLEAVACPSGYSIGTLNCTGQFNIGPFGGGAVLASESYPAGSAADSGGAYPAGFATATAFSGIPEVTAISLGDAEALSTLTYYFEISGPANTSVPIIFAGNLTNQTSVPTFNDLGATITSTLDPSDTFGTYNCIGCFYSTPVIPFSIASGVTSDVVYQVQLFAYSDSALSGQYLYGEYFGPNLGPQQYVDVDPTISIDQTFANAGQFQLEFSPGIGDSTVPEPSFLVPLIMMFAAMAFVYKRRNNEGVLSHKG
jgi:hypothetical protein